MLGCVLFKMEKNTPLYILISIGFTFFSTIGLVWIFKPYLKPMILTQEDIYGTYIIDKEQFPGDQADWQYDHFKFEITPDNKLIFQSRVYQNHWKTETVDVSYSSGYYDLDKKQY